MLFRLLFCVVLINSLHPCIGQEASANACSLENHASCKVGANTLYSFLEENINHDQCNDSECLGKVMTQFKVDTLGKISNIIILDGTCEECNREIKRLLTLLNEFKTKEINGKKVEIKYTLSVTLR